MVTPDVGSELSGGQTRLGGSDDDAAVVLPRVGIGPGHLVGDLVPGWAQADVVDPAEQIEVFGGQRAGRHRSPFKQTGRDSKACHLAVAGQEYASRVGADAVRRGAWAGTVAGFTAVAAMYVAALLTGVRGLPDLLQQPILSIMPGPVFGFLIDNLQHAGKVIEEAGLIVAMVVALAVLGALAGYATVRYGLARAGLLAAAVAWAVVVAIVLPLGGRGFLGLTDGVQTPVIWALVLAVYWLVWDLGWGSPGTADPGAADMDRRRLLAFAPAAIGLGSLALIGFLKVPDWVRIIVAPPESGLSGLSPELTPVDHFYKVSKNFQDPVVSANGWSLRVGGMVTQPLKLSYRDLLAVPATTEVVTLECISNDVGGNLMSTGRFTGIPLRDLLTMAEPRAGAGAVNFKASDGYTESLPLAVVMGAPEIMVVHQLDGAPLSTDHGFPARMLIPGRYGMKGPKWLEEIDVVASAGGGFWEQ